MPRIAIIFEYPSLSGGEFSMLSVLPQIADCELIALAPEAGPLREALNPIAVDFVPFDIRDDGFKRTPAELYSELEAIVRSHRIDLLHANSLSMSRWIGGIAERLPIPCTGHLRDIVQLSRAAVADLNRLAGMVTVSNATREFHLGQGLDAGNVQTIYNGVDCELFQPRPKTGSLASSLGIPPDATIVGSIGQICLRKGFDLIPEVASRLPTREQRIHFVLAGERYSQKDESRAFEADLARRFAAAGLADHFHRLGFRQDVSGLLHEFDVLFHPARQEPLGRVLLEAAAAGCPIVASDVGGTSEIIVPESSGLLFPAHDAETATAQISRMLGDRGFAAALAAAARTRVVEKFGVSRAAGGLNEFWKTVLRR